MELIEIFKAGTRRDANGNLFTISRDDLQKVVDNYKPEFHEAPIVVGHPKNDDPAFGWVDSLILDGDVLKAKPKQVDSQFAEMVREGKYKKISAAFYLPYSQSNPKPESYYLRHVGFLGAMPPAVKGLRDPMFNDDSNDVAEFSDWTQANLWQRMRDFVIEQFGLAKADEVLPAWQIQDLHDDAVKEAEQGIDQPLFNETDDKQGEPTMSEEEKQRIAQLEAENAALKAEKANALKAKRHAENAEFAEGLVASGQLPPKLKEKAVALLNAERDSAEFSEDGFNQSLKDFMGDLPKVMEFSEVATKEKAAPAQDESVEYAEGTDPASIEVDKKVRAYMTEHKVDYVTAFNYLYN